MDRELASVRGTVDLPPEGALDAAQGLLRDLGYAVTDRTDAAVHAERPAPGPESGQPKPALTVTAVPQVTIRPADVVAGTLESCDPPLQRGLAPGPESHVPHAGLF